MSEDSHLIEDPWPTKADALAAAARIAEQARRLYGDELGGVWLYGSRARGDNRPDSDLDVLVVKKSKEFDAGDELWGAMNERVVPGLFGFPAEIYVYVHTAYAEQFEEWDTMFYRNVRADALPVL